MKTTPVLLSTAAALVMGFASAGAQAADAAIKTHDQAATAGKIVIDSVNLPSDGWIVVHAADAQGKYREDQVLGHVAIKSGEHKNVTVTLDKPVKAGEHLAVMLHEDKGVKDKYEFGTGTNNVDAPVMASGKPVVAALVVK